MHEGEWSSRLGLPGVPAAAEEAMLARDLALVRPDRRRRCTSCTSRPGARSTWCAGAKAEGLPVTRRGDPAPPVRSPTTRSAGYDPVFKVNPPLRTGADVAALGRGLADGTIDAIATDHAPHPPEAKDLPFDQAPPGMLGLETALERRSVRRRLGPACLSRRARCCPV